MSKYPIFKKSKLLLMKKVLVLFVALLISNSIKAQKIWILDNSHSQVLFTVSHLVISEVTGSFKKFSANIKSSEPDFTDAQIDFSIDVNSLNTDNEMRDNHLKGDDFFNADKYPKIVFKGKSLIKLNGNKYQLTGDLTIRDVTKTVILDVTYAGTVLDPWENTKAGFKIKGMINRFDYNLKWNNLTDSDSAVAGEDVEITINLELAQAK